MPSPADHRFVFDIAEGGGKILEKSVQSGVAKYLVQHDSGTDWVLPDKLPPGIPQAYDTAYRNFRREKRRG